MTTSGTLTDAFCLLLQRAGMAPESLARQERGYVTGARAKDIISVLRLSLQYESLREVKLWKRPLACLNQKWAFKPMPEAVVLNKLVLVSSHVIFHSQLLN